MAIDPSISLNVKTPEPFSQLKNMLDVQNMAQQVQGGKIALNVANQTQNATIAQKQAEAEVAARTVDPRVSQQQSLASTMGTQAQQADFNLSKDQNDYMKKAIGGLIQSKEMNSGDLNTIGNKLEETRDQLKAMKINPMLLNHVFGSLAHAAVIDPSGMPSHLNDLLNQVTSAEATKANATIPVSGSNQIGTDALGNLTNVHTTPTGGKVLSPVNAPPSVVPALAPGDREAIPVLNDFRTKTNNAAAMAPDQHYNNQQIISILKSPDILNQSGAGAAGLAKVLGSIGLPGGKDYATNTNQLAHYISLQTQNNEKAMGVSTDAGRATASLATGSLEMTPKALINATKVNDATISGLEHFNQGMEKAIQNNGNNVLAARQFRNQWSQVYSPEAMQAYNAYKSDNKEDLQNITQSLGGKDSPQFKDMIQKMQAMEKLAKTGSL